MKLTQKQLKRIIREELSKLLETTLGDQYKRSDGGSSIDYIASVYKEGGFTGFDDPKLVDAEDWMNNLAKDLDAGKWAVPTAEGPVPIKQAKHTGGGRLLVQWGDGFYKRPKISEPEGMEFIKSLVSNIGGK